AKEGIVVAGGQGQGNALTQLSYPQGLFVDTLGTLYVTDALNHRVMRWTRGEKKQGTVIVGGNGFGAGPNQFYYPVGLSYCGSVLRHITSDFNLYNSILGCFLYDAETQSSNNVRMFVNEKLSSFGLNLNNSIFVVTDNENKMRAAFKDKCKKLIKKRGCEKIQNLFGNVKRIVTHVRRSHQQMKLKQKLELYSDTRFNGAFYMLNVFRNVYDDIGGILNDNYMNYLIGVDKYILEELCGFLKRFDQAIDELSEQEKPNMHKVLPIRQLLLNHCNLKSDECLELQELKIFLGERIKTAWILQDQHYMCTLLHPLLKNFDIAPNERAKAFDLVKKELLARVSSSHTIANASSGNINTTTTTTTTNTTTSLASNDLLSFCFDRPQQKIISNSTPLNELYDYMTLDVQINECDDILSFWKANVKSFPTLSAIVCDLFAIPASNTIIERLFSLSKITVSDRRTSLAPDKLNKLLFLQKNMPVLKRKYEQNLKISTEQSKRRLSTIDLQPVPFVDNHSNLTSPSATKETKIIDDRDCDMNITENTDNNDEPCNIWSDF
ncbi:unnamed protein product, partial [Rotaria magnacalcarata]